jgi:hypothetical protein
MSKKKISLHDRAIEILSKSSYPSDLESLRDGLATLDDIYVVPQQENLILVKK